MKKRTSLMMVAAACAALLAAPSFAQTSPPPAGGDMSNMNMKPAAAPAKTKKPMAAKPMKTAAMPMKMGHKSHHKMSCYDYAWESQDMKDCLAKQGSGSKTM
jgi:hypothetical protein